MGKTVLSIKSDKFYINGSLIYSQIKDSNPDAWGLLMNARFIQGIFDDKADKRRFNRFGRNFDPEQNTEELIKALPEWYQYGLRGFTVGFQGGGPCFTMDNYSIDNNPFSSGGKEVDPGYLKRMEKLIRAADELGMIVIVSFLYGAQTRFLKDDEAVKHAVKKASNWLRDMKFTNVIIEIANEHNVDDFKIHPIVYTEKGVVDLIKTAKEESGGIPVGCSGTGGYFSEKIAEVSDVILIHGNGQTRQQLYNLIQKAKSIEPLRPIVCNEDSQALSQLQVASKMQVSWGYYNNMTKQEPPVNWHITAGEDLFFAHRMAEVLGIKTDEIPFESQFYLQGLEPDMTYEQKRWIRLASLYPEKIDHVIFYRNGKYFAASYDDPFMIHFIYNWLQGAVTGTRAGEEWTAEVYLNSGEKIVKSCRLLKLNS